jgi:hypothetical protein
MQERHINMTNYPVLKDQEKTGKYRVIAWPTFGGADAVIAINAFIGATLGEHAQLRLARQRPRADHAVHPLHVLLHARDRIVATIDDYALRQMAIDAEMRNGDIDAAAREVRLVKKPANVSYEEAAAVPFRKRRPETGEAAFVSGRVPA